MKTKVFLIAFFAGLFMLTCISCKQIVDMRLSAFEKSIDKLEEKYKDLTPSELEKAINLCEKQLELLTDSDQELTPNQKKRIANLTGRYHRLLLKIELYTLANEIFDTTEGESVLEYIKGLLLSNNVREILKEKDSI